MLSYSPPSDLDSTPLARQTGTADGCYAFSPSPGTQASSYMSMMDRMDEFDCQVPTKDIGTPPRAAPPGVYTAARPAFAIRPIHSLPEYSGNSSASRNSRTRGPAEGVGSEEAARSARIDHYAVHEPEFEYGIPGISVSPIHAGNTPVRRAPLLSGPSAAPALTSSSLSSTATGAAANAIRVLGRHGPFPSSSASFSAAAGSTASCGGGGAVGDGDMAALRFNLNDLLQHATTRGLTSNGATPAAPPSQASSASGTNSAAPTHHGSSSSGPPPPSPLRRGNSNPAMHYAAVWPALPPPASTSPNPASASASDTQSRGGPPLPPPPRRPTSASNASSAGGAGAPLYSNGSSGGAAFRGTRLSALSSGQLSSQSPSMADDPLLRAIATRQPAVASSEVSRSGRVEGGSGSSGRRASQDARQARAQQSFETQANQLARQLDERLEFVFAFMRRVMVLDGRLAQQEVRATGSSSALHALISADGTSNGDYRESLVRRLEDSEEEAVSCALRYVELANRTALDWINRGHFSAALQLLQRADGLVRKDAGRVFRYLPDPVELGSAAPSPSPANAAATPTSSTNPSTGSVRSINVPFFPPSQEPARLQAAAAVEHNLGIYHFKIGEYAIAASRFARAALLEEELQAPGIGITYFNMAQAQHELRNLPEALRYVELAEEAVEREVFHSKDAATQLRRHLAQQRAFGVVDMADAAFERIGLEETSAFLSHASASSLGPSTGYRPGVAARSPRAAAASASVSAGDEEADRERQVVHAWMRWREGVCFMSCVKQAHAEWLMEMGQYKASFQQFQQAHRWLVSVPRLAPEEEQRAESIKQHMLKAKKRWRREEVELEMYHHPIRRPSAAHNGGLAPPSARHRTSSSTAAARRSSAHQRHHQHNSRGVAAPPTASTGLYHTRNFVAPLQSTVVTSVLPRAVEVSGAVRRGSGGAQPQHPYRRPSHPATAAAASASPQHPLYPASPHHNLDFTAPSIPVAPLAPVHAAALRRPSSASASLYAAYGAHRASAGGAPQPVRRHSAEQSGASDNDLRRSAPQLQLQQASTGAESRNFLTAFPRPPWDPSTRVPMPPPERHVLSRPVTQDDESRADGEARLSCRSSAPTSARGQSGDQRSHSEAQPYYLPNPSVAAHQPHTPSLSATAASAGAVPTIAESVVRSLLFDGEEAATPTHGSLARLPRCSSPEEHPTKAEADEISRESARTAAAANAVALNGAITSSSSAVTTAEVTPPPSSASASLPPSTRQRTHQPPRARGDLSWCVTILQAFLRSLVSQLHAPSSESSADAAGLAEAADSQLSGSTASKPTDTTACTLEAEEDHPGADGPPLTSVNHAEEEEEQEAERLSSFTTDSSTAPMAAEIVKVQQVELAPLSSDASMPAPQPLPLEVDSVSSRQVCESESHGPIEPSVESSDSAHLAAPSSASSESNAVTAVPPPTNCASAAVDAPPLGAAAAASTSASSTNGDNALVGSGGNRSGDDSSATDAESCGEQPEVAHDVDAQSNDQIMGQEAIAHAQSAEEEQEGDACSVDALVDGPHPVPYATDSSDDEHAADEHEQAAHAAAAAPELLFSSSSGSHVSAHEEDAHLLHVESSECEQQESEDGHVALDASGAEDDSRAAVEAEHHMERDGREDSHLGGVTEVAAFSGVVSRASHNDSSLDHRSFISAEALAERDDDGEDNTGSSVSSSSQTSATSSRMSRPDIADAVNDGVEEMADEMEGRRHGSTLLIVAAQEDAEQQEEVSNDDMCDAHSTNAILPGEPATSGPTGQACPTEDDVNDTEASQPLAPLYAHESATAVEEPLANRSGDIEPEEAAEEPAAEDSDESVAGKLNGDSTSANVAPDCATLPVADNAPLAASIRSTASHSDARLSSSSPGDVDAPPSRDSLSAAPPSLPALHENEEEAAVAVGLDSADDHTPAERDAIASPEGSHEEERDPVPIHLEEAAPASVAALQVPPAVSLPPVSPIAMDVMDQESPATVELLRLSTSTPSHLPDADAHEMNIEEPPLLETALTEASGSHHAERESPAVDAEDNSQTLAGQSEAAAVEQSAEVAAEAAATVVENDAPNSQEGNAPGGACEGSLVEAETQQHSARHLSDEERGGNAAADEAEAEESETPHEDESHPSLEDRQLMLTPHQSSVHEDSSPMFFKSTQHGAAYEHDALPLPSALLVATASTNEEEENSVGETLIAAFEEPASAPADAEVENTEAAQEAKEASTAAAAATPPNMPVEVLDTSSMPAVEHIPSTHTRAVVAAAAFNQIAKKSSYEESFFLFASAHSSDNGPRAAYRLPPSLQEQASKAAEKASSPTGKEGHEERRAELIPQPPTTAPQRRSRVFVFAPPRVATPATNELTQLSGSPARSDEAEQSGKRGQRDESAENAALLASAAQAPDTTPAASEAAKAKEDNGSSDAAAKSLLRLGSSRTSGSVDAPLSFTEDFYCAVVPEPYTTDDETNGRRTASNNSTPTQLSQFRTSFWKSIHERAELKLDDGLLQSVHSPLKQGSTCSAAAIAAAVLASSVPPSSSVRDTSPLSVLMRGGEAHGSFAAATAAATATTAAAATASLPAPPPPLDSRAGSLRTFQHQLIAHHGIDLASDVDAPPFCQHTTKRRRGTATPTLSLKSTPYTEALPILEPIEQTPSSKAVLDDGVAPASMSASNNVAVEAEEDSAAADAAATAEESNSVPVPALADAPLHSSPPPSPSLPSAPPTPSQPLAAQPAPSTAELELVPLPPPQASEGEAEVARGQHDHVSSRQSPSSADGFALHRESDIEELYRLGDVVATHMHESAVNSSTGNSGGSSSNASNRRRESEGEPRATTQLSGDVSETPLPLPPSEPRLLQPSTLLEQQQQQQQQAPAEYIDLSFSSPNAMPRGAGVDNSSRGSTLATQTGTASTTSRQWQGVEAEEMQRQHIRAQIFQEEAATVIQEGWRRYTARKKPLATFALMW